MVSAISPNANVSAILNQRKVLISEIIEVLEALMNNSIKARKTAMKRLQEVNELSKKSAQDLAFERTEDKKLETAYSRAKQARNYTSMSTHKAQIEDAIKEEEATKNLLMKMRNYDTQEMRLLKDETANFGKEIAALESLLAFFGKHKNKVITFQENQQLTDKWRELEQAILKNIGDLKLEIAAEQAEISLSTQVARFSGRVRDLVTAINSR